MMTSWQVLFDGSIYTRAVFHSALSLFGEDSLADCDGEDIAKLLTIVHPLMLRYIRSLNDGAQETQGDLRVRKSLYNAWAVLSTDHANQVWDEWMLEAPDGDDDYYPELTDDELLQVLPAICDAPVKANPFLASSTLVANRNPSPVNEGSDQEDSPIFKHRKGVLASPGLMKFTPLPPNSPPAAGPSHTSTTPAAGSADVPIPISLSPTLPLGIMPPVTLLPAASANALMILVVPRLNIPKVEMHTCHDRPAKALAKMKNMLVLAPSTKSKASKRKRSPSEEGEDGQSDKSFIANPPPRKRGRPRKNFPPHQRFIGAFNVPTNLEHLFNKPFMPEPCVQCSMGKNQKEEKCQFQGWGYPCVPCKTAHFTCCEYSLKPVRHAEVHSILGRHPACLAPELIVSHIQDAVFDQQHICANQAIIDSLMYRRDTNMRRAAQALFDLAAIEGKESLVGTIFQTQDDFDHYFPFIMSFLGDLSAPVDDSEDEDATKNSRDNLTEMAVLFEKICPGHPSAEDSDDDNEDNEDEAPANDGTIFYVQTLIISYFFALLVVFIR
ncbi:uncharacterized protein LACBIDRAFT_299547 [Laccaria bicolor S238N-H82]|uniref:Predicted protein n=1 Tax=Laccaria bicolor (strain S238N-H82 / ATCC MYA-4686) TaxID=486041 RepID=B0DEU1_LACBS|nr:uncharacterized protein LACBIDRAFT_299547 [Laccaria bicolor S238N-H82]EDR06726.1 predicted protein [Laccaria bicolor S238N-H82]|eukprot:XP_001882573.1 predicted protein [Laccaria bicolor S238N-H82]